MQKRSVEALMFTWASSATPLVKSSSAELASVENLSSPVGAKRKHGRNHKVRVESYNQAFFFF